jgi:hypothetical protein
MLELCHRGPQPITDFIGPRGKSELKDKREGAGVRGSRFSLFRISFCQLFPRLSSAAYQLARICLCILTLLERDLAIDHNPAIPARPLH